MKLPLLGGEMFLRIQHDLTEHLALLHVLVGDADFPKRITVKTGGAEKRECRVRPESRPQSQWAGMWRDR
jgi:hypothetical protein